MQVIIQRGEQRRGKKTGTKEEKVHHTACVWQQRDDWQRNIILIKEQKKPQTDTVS